MRSRAALFVAFTALPAALGLAWIGCAAGEDGVEGTPKRNTTDTAGLDTEGVIPADGGGNKETGSPGPDGALPPGCGDAAAANACSSAIDLGTIAVGSTKNVADSLSLTGGDRWYKVTFGTLDDTNAHPHVLLTSSDPAIVIEVVKSCAGDTVACGDEDAFATRIKDYEAKYRADPTADAESPYEAGTDAFIPMTVGESGTIYVRVFRTTGAPSGCEFKLDVSN